MNKYQLKEGQINKQGENGVTCKMGHLQKLLMSKRQLNLHTTNFHLGDVKKGSTTGII